MPTSDRPLLSDILPTRSSVFDGTREIDRERFMALAREHTTAIVAETAAGRFLFDLSDRTVGGRLFTEGSRSEIGTLADALEVLDSRAISMPPSSVAVFVDVGANIGTTIVPAMRCGRFARGLAAEPEPRNQRLLHANLALNDVHDRVEVIAAAIGQSSGKARLHLHPTNSGGHEISSSVNRPSFEHAGVMPEGQLEVDLVSLDALVVDRDLDPDAVGLVWMDAQGYEGHILVGAQQLTSRGVPIVVEFWPAALKAAGGLDLIFSALTRHYSDFVDLRELDDLRAPKLRSIDELTRLPDELESEGRADSDLLVLRCPAPAQAPGQDAAIDR